MRNFSKLISINMSVDVFGRKLGRSESSRGPPGIGYKLTEDNQYDIENKRLCNVANPNQITDAVNLDTLKKLIQSEIKGVFDVIKRLRKEVDDLDIIVEGHRDDYDKKILELKLTISEIQEKNNINSSNGT